LKKLEWIGDSLKVLRGCPEDVQYAIGVALNRAQWGDKHHRAKPLLGFGGAGVLEVVDDFDGSTYRAVYTVKFKGVAYVLHVFQKKAKKGIATPKHVIDLIKARLKHAEEHHAKQYKDHEK
jgi:phage-related protein